MTRARLAVFAAAGVVGGVVVGVAAVAGPLALPASAHADVVKVSPAPAEVVAETPASVKVWFTEGVDVTIGGMFVYDHTGARVPTGPLRQPVPSELVLPIRGRLADGPYVVAWRAVSEDSHPIQGTWTFRIGTAGAPGGSVDALAGRLLAAQQPDSAVAAAWALVRGLVYAFLALLVGGTGFGAVIWPRARDDVRTRRVVTIGWSGTTAATVVGLFVFGAYSSGASASGVFDLALLRDTLDTRFGTVWALRLVLLLVAFGLLRVLFAHRPASEYPLPRWWLPAAAVTGVALVCTPGLAGHASSGDLRVLALIGDGVHVGAMALWLGGLVVLAVGVLPRRSIDELQIVVPRFSRVSLWCVGALVITGAFQVWRQVGSLDALRDNDYGRLLVVKLVLFALLLVVATMSREIVIRLMRGGDADPAHELVGLRRSVWAEVAMGAGVLAVTALLVNTAPPAFSSSGALRAPAPAVSPVPVMGSHRA